MAINKPTAIQWKYNIQCAEVNGELKDFSSPLTEEQINTAVSEYEVHLNSTEYKRDRANEYPSWQDQMDMLWHCIDESAELKQKYFAFYETLKAVKAKHPK